MTHERFKSLLSPHFDHEERECLLDYVSECVEIPWPANDAAYRELAVCFLIASAATDNLDRFNSAVEPVIGGKFSREDFDDLINDMDERWFNGKE